MSVKPTRPPPSRPGWAAAAASAAAASASASPAAGTNGGYGGYSAPAATPAAGGGYGGYSAPAATAAPAAVAGGYGGYGQAAGTNGTAAPHAMPGMPGMAAPPLPPKPKPSEPQAKVLYDYDPAGQEGMVAVSAGQVRPFFLSFIYLFFVCRSGVLRSDFLFCAFIRVVVVAYSWWSLFSALVISCVSMCVAPDVVAFHSCPDHRLHALAETRSKHMHAVSSTSAQLHLPEHDLLTFAISCSLSPCR